MKNVCDNVIVVSLPGPTTTEAALSIGDGYAPRWDAKTTTPPLFAIFGNDAKLKDLRGTPKAFCSFFGSAKTLASSVNMTSSMLRSLGRGE